MKKGRGIIQTACTAPKRRRHAAGRRWRAGLSLLELVIALALFSMVLLIFGATFPQALKGGGKASQYMQASLLCQHKIDQLRQVGYGHLVSSPPGNDLKILGIIDTINSAGNYSFTTVDHLVNSGTQKGYFGAAANATGTIKIGPVQALSGQVPQDRAVQVTVTVKWSGSGIKGGDFTTCAIIAAP